MKKKPDPCKKNKIKKLSSPKVKHIAWHINYVCGYFSSAMGQSSSSVREQASSSSVTSRANKYQTSCSSESGQSKPTLSTGFSQMVQQSSQRSAISTHQYAQQSRPPPPAAAAAAPPRRPSSHAVQQKNNSWKFTNSFKPQGSTFERKRSVTPPKTKQPTQTQVDIYMRQMFHTNAVICFVVLFVAMFSRKQIQVSYLLRTHWGSSLQLLMAWDTGASSKTKCLTYLKYSVSWLIVAGVFGGHYYFVH